MNNASLSHNSTYVRLLQERMLNNPDFPRHHMRSPPVKAGISHGDHETAKWHRITAYELFRAQYRIPVPNQYPMYTIPCVRSLHLYSIWTNIFNIPFLYYAYVSSLGNLILYISLHAPFLSCRWCPHSIRWGLRYLRVLIGSPLSHNFLNVALAYVCWAVHHTPIVPWWRNPIYLGKMLITWVSKCG